MASQTRRRFIGSLSVTLAASQLAEGFAQAAAPSWRLAAFNVDVTPRIGHPLLGNLYRPSTGVDDPLSARGLVLYGPAPAIVIVAVDWCELRNDAFDRWRQALAEAAKTTTYRVLVTAVHQHDAPYFDLTAQRFLAASSPGGLFCDVDFHERTVQRVAEAVKKSLDAGQPVTHVGTGQAKVEEVASNRRVVLPEGKPVFHRGSSCRDPLLRSLPAGEIDPWLKSISFWNGATPLAVLSSYACHPMSYYGSGAISGDFVNMARDRRQQDDKSVFQVYTSGCCGDVTAGKYNDGAKPNRPVFADRLYRGMVDSFQATKKSPLEKIVCRSVPMTLPYSELASLQKDALEKTMNNGQLSLRARADAALGLSTLARNSKGLDIDLQVIDLGVAQMALLPAESFVSYQLKAQELKPDGFVMAIGFGQSSAGYLPTDAAFREGFREQHGYCWVAPGSEAIMHETLKKALA